MSRLGFLLFLVLFLLPAAPSRAQGFRKAFDEAASLGDRAAMARIISKQPGRALNYARQMLETLAANPDDKVTRDRFDLMKEVFKTAMKTSLLEHMEAFYTKGGPDAVARLHELNQKFNAALGRIRAFQNGKADAWAEAYTALTQLAKEYEDLGELLMASQCYSDLWFLESRNPKGKSNEKIFQILDKFVKCRQAWDFKIDANWANAWGTYRGLKRLKEQGKSLEQAGARPGAGKTAGPELRYAPGSRWVRVKGKFKAWTRFDRGVSSVTAASPILWRYVFIRGIYKPGTDQGIGKFYGFEPELRIMRLKPSEYWLDSNVDGKPDVRVKVGGKPRLCIFPRTIGGEKTKGALFFWVGGSQENLSGVPVNLAPSAGRHPQASLNYRGATCLEVNIQGQKLLFIDENASGAFGDAPVGFSLPHHKPYSVLITDSMVLPGSKDVVPFSDFILLADGYYKFKFSGMTAKFRKLDMSTTPLGRLKLQFKGPKSAKPVHFILGEVTVFSGAYFDLAANPKGVEVPAGRYRVIGGLILKGRGSQAKVVSISSGKAPVYEVKPGKETIVKCGAPYKLDFTYSAAGRNLRVDGMSVKIFGAGGEVYLDIWEGTPQPFVFVRRGGKGNGKKVGRMKVAKGAAELNRYLAAKRAQIRNFGIRDVVFSPMDLNVRNPYKGPVEVRLVEPRNKYFGKVVSDWK